MQSTDGSANCTAFIPQGKLILARFLDSHSETVPGQSALLQRSQCSLCSFHSSRPLHSIQTTAVRFGGLLWQQTHCKEQTMQQCSQSDICLAVTHRRVRGNEKSHNTPGEREARRDCVSASPTMIRLCERNICTKVLHIFTAKLCSVVPPTHCLGPSHTH